MSDQYEEQNTDSSGQGQVDGGTGGEGGGDENNEADMIFTPEASKPGRNAGMLMIAFVMIGVGVIYFMRARGGPKVAVSAEMTRADTVIKSFDSNQVQKMKTLLRDTEKVVRIMNDDPAKSRPDPVIEGKKNPFSFISPNARPDEDPNDKKARDDRKRAELRRQKFAEDVNSIRVQYIMISPFAKTAMINNKLVQEGQEVDGFTIEKLTPNTVIVQRDGQRAEIKTTKELK